jgi:hypothetical protein
LIVPRSPRAYINPLPAKDSGFFVVRWCPKKFIEIPGWLGVILGVTGICVKQLPPKRPENQVW